MTLLLTPGLYRQPALPVRATGTLARGDVALFLGYAVRGPVGVPVRVESPALFETLFGPRPAQGFLWPAVKGFFENGGAAAYALRLTDSSATAASAPVGPWTARASFPWPMIDPRRLRGATQAATASWVQIVEAQIREGGVRSPDPGTWGNGLTVEIRRSSRALTETVPGAESDPLALALASLSGIEAKSVLELSQVSAAGTAVTAHIQPTEVDTARRLIRLAVRPATFGLDARRVIRVASRGVPRRRAPRRAAGAELRRARPRSQAQPRARNDPAARVPLLASRSAGSSGLDGSCRLAARGRLPAARRQRRADRRSRRLTGSPRCLPSPGSPSPL